MPALIINNYYTPYRDDLYAAIQRLNEGEGDVSRVLYVSAPEAKRKMSGWLLGWQDAKANAIAVDDPAVIMGRSGRRVSLPIRTVRQLKKLDRKSIICGFSRDMVLVQILCLWFARARGAKLVYWIGDVKGAPPAGVSARIIDAIRLFCARRADGAIFYSEKSRDWFADKNSGREPRAVWIGGQVRNRIEETATRTEKSEFVELGREQGVLKLLFVGTNEPRKGLGQLVRDLKCIELFLDRPIRLLVAGMQRPNTHEWDKLSILWLGHLKSSDLYSVYQSSDIPIIASLQEPWGFVFNEAVLAGRPCIVAESAGASVVAKAYGLAYVPGAPKSLLLAIRNAQSIEREKMLKIEESLSVERAAKSFSDFLKLVESGGSGVVKDY